MIDDVSDDDGKMCKKKYPNDSVESMNPISRADRIEHCIRLQYQSKICGMRKTNLDHLSVCLSTRLQEVAGRENSPKKKKYKQ